MQFSQESVRVNQMLDYLAGKYEVEALIGKRQRITIQITVSAINAALPRNFQVFPININPGTLPAQSSPIACPVAGGTSDVKEFAWRKLLHNLHALLEPALPQLVREFCGAVVVANCLHRVPLVSQ
jgi:hypothetical protein